MNNDEQDDVAHDDNIVNDYDDDDDDDDGRKIDRQDNAMKYCFKIADNCLCYTQKSKKSVEYLF